MDDTAQTEARVIIIPLTDWLRDIGVPESICRAIDDDESALEVLM